MVGVRMISVRDNGDATTTYNIDFTKEYAVTQFCEAVVSENPKEWGNIYVNGEKVMEYKYGRMTALGAYFKYCSKPAVSGWANGGWSSMDYHLKVAE